MSDQPVLRVLRNVGASTPPSYWIPKHTYVCATSNGGVILDLRGDRYIGVPLEQMSALATIVADWPVLDLPASYQPSVHEAMELAKSLHQQGLLTRDAEERHCSALIELPRAVTSIDACRDDTRNTRIKVTDLRNFFFAVMRARRRLRRSLHSSVTGFMEIKREATASDAAFDKQRAAELVAIFRRLKTLIYLGKDKCLLETLALLDFLSRYQLFPTWVIGVSVRPFKAHSWVQYENVVLGMNPDDVHFSYTPIMVV